MCVFGRWLSCNQLQHFSQVLFYFYFLDCILKGVFSFDLIYARSTQFLLKYKVTVAFCSLQSDCPAREEATSLNNPSEGSEDQDEALDSADQGSEDFSLLFLLWSIIHP